MNAKIINSDEFHQILEYIENNPEKSQREISTDLNFSLGKVNFLLKELTKIGIIQLDRFLNLKSKWSYRYIITPHGVNKKLEIARSFLKRKELEYESLRVEIEKLKSQI